MVLISERLKSLVEVSDDRGAEGLRCPNKEEQVPFGYAQGRLSTPQLLLLRSNYSGRDDNFVLGN